MRRLFFASLCAAVMLFCGILHAQSLGELLLGLSSDINDSSRSSTGLTAFPTLLIPAGGEYATMGAAYTAMSRDVGAFDANPAASSRLAFTEAALSHRNLIADANLENLAFAHRIDDFGFGVALRMMHVPFTEYGADGIQLNNSRYVELIGILNASYNFSRSFGWNGIAVGANFKLAYRGIADLIASNQSALSAMGDIGVMTGFDLFKFYSSRDNNVTVGVAVRNIGNPALNEPLPSEVAIGISYSPLKPLLLAGGIAVPFILFADGEPAAPHWTIGFALSPTDFLSLQTSFAIKGNNPRLGLGTTIALEGVALHAGYSIDATTQFQSISNFTIQVSIKLDDGGRAARARAAMRDYLQAQQFLIESRYDDAIRAGNRALEVDPTFEPARDTVLLAERLKQQLELFETISLGRDFFSGVPEERPEAESSPSDENDQPDPNPEDNL